jgi:hypothetical protein
MSSAPSKYPDKEEMRKCLTLVNSTEQPKQNQKESPRLEAFSGSGLSVPLLLSAAALLLQIGPTEEPLY